MQQTLSMSHTMLEFLCSQELRSWLRMLVKPLAVLMALAALLWLGAWLDAQIVHAETLDLACPAGLEQNGQLCYPPCQDGFYGEGPICWQKCPTDYQDDGAFCRKDAHSFAKASYGRGAGVSLVCASNQEAQGGLCYPRCNAGYYGVGPVCWQFCRAGYADHGATCFKHIFDFYGKPTYGRGAGVAVSVCAPGLERNGSLCYPRCNTGFYGAGPVCFQQCPSGYRDDGALCRKDAIIMTKASFGRGAGLPLNTVPNALDATFQTAKNTPVEITFEHEDFDDDRSLPTTIVQQPTHGAYDGERYIPNQDFEGEDLMLWKVNDGKNDSNTAIITILVGTMSANVPPVALDRTVGVLEEIPITITVTCTDDDNDDLFYQLLETPKHGEYEWQEPNTVIYTPTVDFVGIDSFTFRSHDGQAFSNVSTITLPVAAVNDAPLALAQPFSTTRNSNAAITLSANDAEGDPISYTIVSSPTQGLLSGAVPHLLYTPAHNFVGEDSFQFQASDQQGAATVATIRISVRPTNTAPIAESMMLTTSEEVAVAVNLTATDADQDALTYTLVTSPTHGVLTGADADWVYMPTAGFTGIETFTFQANDGQTDAPVATVAIHITPAPSEASVVGIVFDDSNGNGQPDANETGVHGLRVMLTPANAAVATFTTTSDRIGAWRIDGVPLGQYTLRIEAAAGIQLMAPVEMPMTVGQRGVQQIQPASVNVTGHSLFLPVVTR